MLPIGTLGAPNYIYLSATIGSSTWNGDCTWQLCTSTSPCIFAGGSSNYQIDCDLVLVSGGWNFGVLFTVPHSNTLTNWYLVGAGVTNLYLTTATYGGAVNLLSLPGQLTTPVYMGGNYTVSVTGSATGATTMSMSSVSFQESVVSYSVSSNGLIPSMSISGITHSQSTLSTYPFNLFTSTSVGPTVNVTGSKFSLSSSTRLFNLPAHTVLNISNSILNVNSIALNGAPLMASIQSSTVILTGTDAFSSNTSLTLVNSNLTGATTFSNLPIDTDFTVVNSNVERIAMSTKKTFYATASNFLNVQLKKLASPIPFTLVQSCNFNVSAPLTYLDLEGTGTAEDLQVTTGGSVGTFNLVNTVFSNTSSVTADYVNLACPTQIVAANLTVTAEIVAVACSPTSPTSTLSAGGVGYFDVTWTFGSISIKNIAVDLTNVALLKYAVTNATYGMAANGITIISPPPRLIQIAWDDSVAGVPVDMKSYPLIQLPGTPTLAYASTLPIYNDPLDHHLWSTFVSTNNHVYFYFGYACALPLPLGFYCKNGVITSDTDVNEPSIVIPPLAGTVFANGSVVVSSGITFNGLGSSLGILGCLTAPDGITIVIPGGSQLPTAPVQLISQSEACNKTLSDFQISIQQEGGPTCAKTTVTKQETTPGQLSIIFQLDSSACKKHNNNTTGIIVGSTIGSVVAIAAVAALVFTLSPKARRCIRPHSGKKAVDGNVK